MKMRRNDLLGTMLQESLVLSERKKLAVNYTTNDSANLIISLLNTTSFTSIMDPFCGSGRLISAYLRKLELYHLF